MNASVWYFVISMYFTSTGRDFPVTFKIFSPSEDVCEIRERSMYRAYNDFDSVRGVHLKTRCKETLVVVQSF